MAASREVAEQSLPGWQWWDFLVAFVALCGLFLLFSDMPAAVSWAILLSSLLCLALGARRPAFILGSVVILELTMQTYTRPGDAGFASYRYTPILVAVAGVLVLLPRLVSDLRLGPGAMRVLVPGGAFVVMAIVTTSMGITPELTTEAARFFGVGLIFMFLIPLLVRDGTDLKVVGKIVIGVFVFSAVIAVLQGIPSLPSFTAGGAVVAEHQRVIALTSTTIRAANILSIGFLLCFGITTALKLDNRWGVVFLLFTALLGIAWYYTYTRSALYAAAVGVMVALPFLRGTVRVQVFLGTLLLGSLLGYGVLSAAKDDRASRYAQGTSDDRSAAGRVVLWKVGLAMIKDNLEFGTGYASFIRLAPEYLDQVDVSRQDEWYDAAQSLVTPVHNDFLRVWQEFGTLTLVAYLLLILGALRNSTRAYFRAQEPWLRGASLGVLVALVGYLVGSFFHNSMNTSYALWGLAGFSIALLKVAVQPLNDIAHSLGPVAE